MDVTSMDEWRRRRSSDVERVAHEGDPALVCECGSWFFELREGQRIGGGVVRPTVTLRANGLISSYTGTPYCVRCGEKAFTL